jgi:hypothetical protein
VDPKASKAIQGEWPFVKKLLDTDDDGWIPPEYDFTEMKSRNKMLFDYRH